MKYRDFIQDYFTIDHPETGALIPFRFRKVQDHYYDILCKDYSEQEGFRGLRELVLKARKEGFTSMILALFCADLILNDNPVRYLEISYKDDSTKQHFRRAKNFILSWARKKTGITDDKKLEKLTFDSISEGSEFVLRHNKASFFVGTASTRTGERGGTVQGVLFSESAFYPDTGVLNASEIIEATRNQVAVGSGMIFLESTANRRNHFYTLYQQAKAGEVDYKPRFFSWDTFYTQEEFEKIKAGFGDKSLIAQEYPANDNEAFLSGGDYYFNTESLKKYDEGKKKPIVDGLTTNPLFRQYREIKPREQFVIAGDCSQGGRDYNALQFYSKTRLDVPIVYHSRGVAASMTADLIPVAESLYEVTGIPPIIALERSMGGASEMERLRVLNRYAKFHLFTMPQIGAVIDRDTGSLGYTTTQLTRPILVGELKDIVDGSAIGIYDEDTIAELFSFIINNSGKPIADTTSHDDLVISLGIAIQVAKSARFHVDNFDQAAWDQQAEADMARINNL